ACSIVVLLTLVPALATSAAPAAQSQLVPGRVVVGFRDGIDQGQRAQLHVDASARGAGSVRVLEPIGPRAQLVEISSAASIGDALRIYRGDPRVRYAEPDFVVKAFDVPNDPQFPNQWGPRMIQAPAAWDVTHGSTTRTIAILDCGIFDDASTR